MRAPIIRRAALTPAFVLSCTGFLTPVLAVGTPLALAPLLGIAAVAVVALGGYRNLPRLVALRPLIVLLGLLCLWATASGLWSILPLHSFLEGLRLAVIVSAGLALTATGLALEIEELRRVWRALFWGLLLALLLLALAGIMRMIVPTPPDTPLGHWLRLYTRFDRGSTTIALMLWPVMIGLIGRRRRIALGGLVLVACVVIFALPSRAAMLSLIIGGLVVPIAWAWPRFAATAIAATIAVLAAAMPSLPLDAAAIARLHQAAPSIPASGLARLAIWDFGAARIAERPILGWGIDASRALPHGSEQLDDPALPDILIGYTQKMPLHPHNALLQWRIELGIPGVVLCLLALLWIVILVPRTAGPDRAITAVSTAIIPASLVIGLLSYGVWQAWWLSCLWLLALFTLAALRDAAPGRDPR